MARLQRLAGNAAVQKLVIQRFYVEQTKDPGFKWAADNTWDDKKYEVSENSSPEHGWTGHQLYKRAGAKPRSEPPEAPDINSGWWEKHKGTFRQAVADLERDPKKFNAGKAAETLKSTLETVLGERTGLVPPEQVEDLKEMVDTLPNYFPEHVVNAALKALGAYGPQIGKAGLSYLAPGITKGGKDKDDEHVINRGISEAVLIEGQYYTPIYMAVFGDALGPEQPAYKDVGQDEKGRVQIHTGGGGENTLWMSIGRPLRQIKWVEKYGGDPNAKEPLVRSFLVPMDIADLISGDSITEHNSGGLGRDLNVDKHYERNQYGVVDEESLEKLRQYALPGSLRTYTDKSTENRPKNWGQTRSTGELRGKLGVPQERLKDFNVFTEPSGGKGEFTGKGDYPAQVNNLTLIYAYFTGNEEFLPPNEQMPDKAERDKKVLEFYNQHKPQGYPDNPSGIPKFIEEVVKPWATQAQIAKVISEDYDDLSGKERDTLPTKPTGVTFGEESITQRGQRRSKEVALSKETRDILQPRFEFIKAVRAAKSQVAEAFKAIGGHASRPILGRLVAAIEPMLADYKFVNGDVERIKAQLPTYVTTITGFQAQLAPHAAHEKVAPIVASLATAAAIRLPG